MIEEGIVQAKTIGINFDYDDGTSAEWLRLYSERLLEAVKREAYEEAGNYVDELYQTGNMGDNEYMLLTEFFDYKLKAQLNNSK